MGRGRRQSGAETEKTESRRVREGRKEEFVWLDGVNKGRRSER